MKPDNKEAISGDGAIPPECPEVPPIPPDRGHKAGTTGTGGLHRLPPAEPTTRRGVWVGPTGKQEAGDEWLCPDCSGWHVVRLGGIRVGHGCERTEPPQPATEKPPAPAEPDTDYRLALGQATVHAMKLSTALRGLIDVVSANGDEPRKMRPAVERAVEAGRKALTDWPKVGTDKGLLLQQTLVALEKRAAQWREEWAGDEGDEYARKHSRADAHADEIQEVIDALRAAGVKPEEGLPLGCHETQKGPPPREG